MNTEQERADFEAWWESTPILKESKRTIAEKAYQAGRAALQSQHDEETKHLRDALWFSDRRIEALQSQDREGLLKALIIAEDMLCKQENALRSFGAHEPCAESAILSAREAIDHARRIEGGGE